jgi:hypothetical protein
MNNQQTALRLALEALVLKYSDAMYDALGAGVSADFELDVAAIKQALAAPVQEPDWKSEYQNAVELHCMTLDELREADAWIKNLEKLMADQDVMLKRQTARIVDLQTHIDNFDGEDR